MSLNRLFFVAGAVCFGLATAGVAVGVALIPLGLTLVAVGLAL